MVLPPARFVAVPVLVGLVACVSVSFPMTESSMANRAARDLPRGSCLGGWSSEAGVVYAPANTRQVDDTGSLESCTTLLVLLPAEHPRLIARAEETFGSPQILPATTDGLLFR